MKGVTALLLLAMSLAAADLTIDHVTVAGSDLKLMQARLAAVGIPSDYGGPHRNGVTEMALTSFPDGSYLELIAPAAGADPKGVSEHYWGKLMLGEAGACAWAARAHDLAAEVARLKTAGIEVGAPVHSGRERPDGTRLEWETAVVGTGPPGSFFPFLIRDFTARSDRAYRQGKPTTEDFGGVVGVVIAVRDLDAAVTRYRAAYGLAGPARQADQTLGVLLARMAGTPVILAAPLEESSWLKQRLDRFGSGPCAFILSARRPAKYAAASKTTWFGTAVSWFDPEKLVCRLGFASGEY